MFVFLMGYNYMKRLELLNHNVKIADKIYHIQTERLKDKNIILTQVFHEGHVLYSDKVILTNETEEKVKAIIKNTHKNTLIYLRGENMNLSELKPIKYKTITY